MTRPAPFRNFAVSYVLTSDDTVTVRARSEAEARALVAGLDPRELLDLDPWQRVEVGPITDLDDDPTDYDFHTDEPGERRGKMKVVDAPKAQAQTEGQASPRAPQRARGRDGPGRPGPRARRPR